MKQLSLRFGGMLAFVFLLCFSCTDHEPGRQPRVFTVEAITSPTAAAVSFRLTIEAGDFPITEYGVVYSLKENANDNVFNTTPTVADTKVVFPLPATNGQHTKVENVVPFVEMYYRAYAVVDGIGVIYGDVMVIDKDGPNSDLPIIKTLSVDFVINPNPNSTLDYNYNLEFTSLGNKTIKEYGIVYDYAEQPNDPYETVPTILNHKVKFTSLPKLGKITQFDPGPEAAGYSREYYRAYVILEDDTVIYASETLNFD